MYNDNIKGDKGFRLDGVFAIQPCLYYGFTLLACFLKAASRYYKKVPQRVALFNSQQKKYYMPLQKVLHFFEEKARVGRGLGKAGCFVTVVILFFHNPFLALEKHLFFLKIPQKVLLAVGDNLNLILLTRAIQRKGLSI